MEIVLPTTGRVDHGISQHTDPLLSAFEPTRSSGSLTRRLDVRCLARSIRSEQPEALIVVDLERLVFHGYLAAPADFAQRDGLDRVGLLARG